MSQLSLDTFPRSGTNYPFVAPPGNLAKSVQDLSISSFDTPRVDLWLKWVVGLGEFDVIADPAAVHAVDLLIVDDNDTPIFDTRTWSYQEYSWTGNVIVASWRNATTVITATVVRDPTSDYFQATQVGLLDPRVAEWRARPVTDCQVLKDGSWVSAIRSDKSIRIREGYNARFVITESSNARGDTTSDIEIAFVSGEGLGLVDGCTADIGIQSLGDARPEANGDLLIGGDACISLTPVVQFGVDTATIVPGEFILQDACESPCKCSQFVDLLNYTKRVWSRLQTIALRSKEIRDAYHGIRDFLLDAKSCAEQNTLRGFVWPVRPCAFAAAVGICNPSDEPLHDVVLQFTIVGAGDVDLGAKVTCTSIHRVDHHLGQRMPVPYVFEAPLPEASVTLRCIPPGGMGYVIFHGEIDEPVEDTEVAIQISATSLGETVLPLPEDLRVQTKLVCPVDDNCEGSGSISGSPPITGEVPTGDVNGVNATYTTYYDFVPGTVSVTVNGLEQRLVTDFQTIGTNQIVFTESPQTGDSIQVTYTRG